MTRSTISSSSPQVALTATSATVSYGEPVAVVATVTANTFPSGDTVPPGGPQSPTGTVELSYNYGLDQASSLGILSLVPSTEQPGASQAVSLPFYFQAAPDATHGPPVSYQIWAVYKPDNKNFKESKTTQNLVVTVNAAQTTITLAAQV